MKTRTPRARPAAKPARKAVVTRNAPSSALPGELAQLAAVRARYHALPPATSSSLLAQHDEASCRDQGLSTKAKDTFTGAMGWARTFGEHSDDPGVPPQLVRWFLDCLTSLGTLLAGHAVANNPADAAALEDASHAADKLLHRVQRRARDACGSNPAWRTVLETALAPPDGLDPRVVKLTSLADLLTHWLDARTSSREPPPPLIAYGLSGSTVVSLRHAATLLNTALANKPAARQVDLDSPEVNTAEGRLFYVMRALWHDLAEAREDGRTALKLGTTPALVRGLNLHSRVAAKKAGSAAGAGSANAAPT